MLFVFPRDGYHGIWMKDMHFAIDILWLDKNGMITDAVRDVAPDTYPRVFVPTRPVRYVLEIPRGFISQNNVRAGDAVRILSRD